jgi:hypothetical protein
VGRRLSFAWLGVALLWATEASALDSGGFTLETGSPDALCPDLEATREIVARRLGSLVVEGRKGWLARYTIGHAPAGNPRDFVRLELFNPEGGLELRRDLPMEGDSCRTMSEVIALVLDRHFRGLAGSEAAETTQTPEEGRPALAMPPSSSHTLARVPEQAPHPREPVRTSRLSESGQRRRLSAEYAVSRAQPDLGLRFSTGLGFRPKLEATFALRWGLTSLKESEPQGARVEARTVTSRASVAVLLTLPPGVLHFGPVLSLALQRATTRGLQTPTDRVRALWMTGVEVGFVTPLGRHLFLEGSSSLDFVVPGASGQFLVDNREVLSPPSLVFGWALGFGYAWGN